MNLRHHTRARARLTFGVGRQVNVQNAHVAATMATGGFWVDAGGDRLFVLPAGDPQTGVSKVKQGDRVNIMGTVLELPRGHVSA